MRALLILLALSLFGTENPWAELREKNPPEMEFLLRPVESRAYRQGELIEVEVTFPGRPFTPGSGSDESWQSAGVLLDPAVECGTIEQPCTFIPERFMKFDPMLSLGLRAEPAAAALNTYMPTLAPGRYRAAVLMRKLVLKHRAPMSATYGYADPQVLAVSNAVGFEILPASEKWIAQAVERCVKTLEGPQQHTREGYEMRRAAAQQLSFLDHPPAWRASLDLLPTEESVLLAGLSASGAPTEVCSLMRERLAAPQQVVSIYYMSRMVGVCRRADLPVPPGTDAPEEERAEYVQSSRLYDAALNREAHAELAASLWHKQPEAKASALETPMRRIQRATPWGSFSSTLASAALSTSRSSRFCSLRARTDRE